MKILFWLCAVLIFYVYVGYAVWLRVLMQVCRRPVQRGPATPTVSIIIAAHNEEANLPGKLKNLQHLTYAKQPVQIVVASDGSTDQTAELLSQCSSTIVPVILEHSEGKASALNAAVKRSTGDILLFLDVRQTVDADAISELTSCFADPAVGAVSGELLLEEAANGTSSNSLGLYWKLEKLVRKLESATGSVVGATGAIYAIRRELYTQMPQGTILDDVFIPMHVARMGKRVVFQPSAIARDRLFEQRGKEFSRKVRTLTGNYQLLRLAPWLLSPANPLLFRFISHKLLRLCVPFLLVITLVSSSVLHGDFYLDILCLQVIFYILAVLGILVPSSTRFKPVSLAKTFVVLNAAAVMALVNVVVGRKRVWV